MHPIHRSQSAPQLYTPDDVTTTQEPASVSASPRRRGTLDGLPRPQGLLSARMTQQRRLLERVQRWAQAPGYALEWRGRQLAAQRIKTCIENRETVLCLRGLHLTSLPACLAELGALTTLNVADNQLMALPALPVALTGLIASNNRLTALPALPATLTTLDVYHNQLAALPALPAALTDLVASNNKLRALPALPPTLAKLDVCNNRLTALPVLVQTLTQIFAGGNRLAALPALPAALTWLRVNTNLLTTLPALPAALTQLEAADNLLATLPALPAGLRYLYAANNQLIDLPALPAALMWLSVSNNELAALPALPAALTQLRAEANELTVLPDIPDSLTALVVDPGLIAVTRAALVARIKALNADLHPHLRQGAAALPAPTGAAPGQRLPQAPVAGGFQDMPSDVIRRLTAHFELGSPSVARLAMTSRHFGAVLAGRVAEDKRRTVSTRMQQALEQFTILDRFG